jgi:hypothetical protein
MSQDPNSRDRTCEQPNPDGGLIVAPEAQFFRETLLAAMGSRGVQASEQSELYLTSLLNDQVRSSEALERLQDPLSVRLLKAMQASGTERFDKLRTLGDDVLFTSGFFAAHLERRGLQQGYVAGVGQLAYGGVASMLRTYGPAPSLFDELADGFHTFVELLRFVADSLVTVSLRVDSDIAKLYERWSRTGSSVLADVLLRMGLLPTKTVALC